MHRQSSFEFKVVSLKREIKLKITIEERPQQGPGVRQFRLGVDDAVVHRCIVYDSSAQPLLTEHRTLNSEAVSS